VLEAVLFDWGNTLVHLEWDDELVAAGHRAGLGRDDPDFTARWREQLLNGARDRPYEEILAELGVEDPGAFIDREHEVWRPQYAVLASARALLESLRDRGLKTGLVANAWPDPARVLRADAESLGLAPLLDVLVFSAAAGVRKPDAAIFLRACSDLAIDPAAVLFVGDDPVNDVQGAANVGMTTAQALWFKASEAAGIEPDFQVFTAMDVLNIAARLARFRQ
jgi:HAD superfamily hydrolase (TIGR01509 family)